MKIGFLGPAPPHKGGISQFALSLAGSFLQSRHQVRMFGFKKQYPRLLFPGKTQTAQFKLPQGLEIQNCYIPYLPHTWLGAIQEIRDFAPDILIVSYFIPFFAPSYIAICRALKKDTRIIALVHNLFPHETWLGSHALAKSFLSLCDTIILLSGATLKELKASMPNRIAQKAKLGFHPVYDQYLSSDEPSPERDPMCILFFGLVKKYKGLDILLKAMPAIIRDIPQIRLLIGGEVYGSDESYTQLISSLGIQENVEAHFRFIPDEQVPQFFKRASLCVLPYRSATQSGIIALSYAFGLPVAAPRLEGLAEYIVPDQTGFLLDAGPELDSQDLARGIIHYISQNMYQTMHPAVLEKAAELSWSKLAELFLA